MKPLESIHVPSGDEITIMITIGSDGTIIKATDEKGNPLKYDNEEKRLDNTKTRLLCPNICCWKNIGGRMYCHPAFC